LIHEDLGMMQRVKLQRETTVPGNSDESVRASEQTFSSHWSAVDQRGKRLSSENYRGKLVLLVLHRGIECIHCAEQLSRLRREHDLLLKIGVSVVAISPKLPEGEQVDQFLSEIPFPVLTDTSKETFRTFNCLDSSDEPIHGLFLLDPQSNCLFENRSDTAIEDPTQWIFEKLQYAPQGEKK
jgi:peroxiredoxin